MTYVVQILLGKDANVRAGKLGELRLRKGAYYYIGSACNGLRARIKRHLSKKKNLFWHIDYLSSLRQARINKIWIHAGKIECGIARALKNQGYGFIDKFGSSDCRCESHLFFSKSARGIRDFLRKKRFKDADKSSF